MASQTFIRIIPPPDFTNIPISMIQNGSDTPSGRAASAVTCNCVLFGEHGRVFTNHEIIAFIFQIAPPYHAGEWGESSWSLMSCGSQPLTVFQHTGAASENFWIPLNDQQTFPRPVKCSSMVRLCSRPSGYPQSGQTAVRTFLPLSKTNTRII